jgi:hypothetical protein
MATLFLQRLGSVLERSEPRQGGCSFVGLERVVNCPEAAWKNRSLNAPRPEMSVTFPFGRVENRLLRLARSIRSKNVSLVPIVEAVT